MSSLRAYLCTLGKLLADANAAAKGKIARRVGRRAAGKASGRLMRRLFG